MFKTTENCAASWDFDDFRTKSIASTIFAKFAVERTNARTWKRRKLFNNFYFFLNVVCFCQFNGFSQHNNNNFGNLRTASLRLLAIEKKNYLEFGRFILRQSVVHIEPIKLDFLQMETSVDKNPVKKFRQSVEIIVATSIQIFYEIDFLRFQGWKKRR